MTFSGIGEIDRGCIGAHADGFDRVRGRKTNKYRCQQRARAGSDKTQPVSSELHSLQPFRELRRSDPVRAEAKASRLYVYFTAHARSKSASRPDATAAKSREF